MSITDSGYPFLKGMSSTYENSFWNLVSQKSNQYVDRKKLSKCVNAPLTLNILQTVTTNLVPLRHSSI